MRSAKERGRVAIKQRRSQDRAKRIPILRRGMEWEEPEKSLEETARKLGYISGNSICH